MVHNFTRTFLASRIVPILINPGPMGMENDVIRVFFPLNEALSPGSTVVSTRASKENASSSSVFGKAFRASSAAVFASAFAAAYAN